MKRYVLNLLYWLTQTLNVWTGGDPDEYFSSRVGKAQRAEKRWGITFEPGEQESLLAFGDFVEACRATGREQRAALGL